MATVKPELSKKNKYWISKERYYELKHFCLQYEEWAKQYRQAYVAIISTANGSVVKSTDKFVRPVEDVSILKEIYLSYINKVKRASLAIDPALKPYILRAVISGKSYDELNALIQIPSCKDKFYEEYRHFFWELDKIRD